MPFIGAVCCDRDVRDPSSALCLITDSAYGKFTLSKCANNAVSLNTEFERDPERRRLDIKLLLLPKSNHVPVARAYRENLIAERNHTTLRRKMRDRPNLSTLIGSVSLWSWDRTSEHASDLLFELRDNCHVPHAQIPINRVGNKSLFDDSYLQQIKTIASVPYDSIVALNLVDYGTIENSIQRFQSQVTGVYFWNPAVGLSTRHEDTSQQVQNIPQRNYWDEMEWRLDQLKLAADKFGRVGMTATCDEWAMSHIDFTYAFQGNSSIEDTAAEIPLWSVCFHDSVVPFVLTASNKDFLRTLMALALPLFPSIAESSSSQGTSAGFITRISAILCPLHIHTFSTFLSEHVFLSKTLEVQEAIYTDKTRVIINQSETEVYQSDEFYLPPLGFYVRHTQMEAHDALRVGEQTFATRAWRIRRSLDGKPLETSEDVLVQEFPV